MSMRIMDRVFVYSTLPQTLNKQFPQATIRVAVHRIGLHIPAIKIAHHRNLSRIRRPDDKLHTAIEDVCAHFFV